MITKNRKIFILLYASILMSLVSLVSCSFGLDRSSVNQTSTEVSKILDGGLLSEEVCGPPCFFGVIPDVTTKNDAINILRSKGLYQNCEEFDNSKQSGVHAIGCDYLILFLNENMISGIGFQPSQQITVEEVIKKYGNPSVVSVAAIDPSNRGDFTAFMTLFYDSIRVSLGLAEQKSGQYDLTPDTLVASINYDDQDSYKLGRKYSQKWNGYGVYQETNP